MSEGTVTKLSASDRAAMLNSLPGWEHENDHDAIRKEFVFGDFVEAFAFMTRVALAAEKMDHHPDWSNVYKTVEVRLNTHDAGGLTALDFDLAKKMDRIFGG